jgi:threonine/homoserine/homoserine lactone efflux protein
MMPLFFKGLLIGFAIAAPVGPIGILCIQRSIHEGFKIGLMTGLGAAFADGVYGVIAGFGLTSISSYLLSHQFWVRLLGGVFLLYLGLKLLFKKPLKKLNTFKKERSSLHAFNTTFLLTLTNPTTIFAFLAVFAGLGIGTVNLFFGDSLILIVGILFGSAAWWFLLTTSVVYVFHHRLSDEMLQSINKISGIVIFIFGIGSIVTATVPFHLIN